MEIQEYWNVLRARWRTIVAIGLATTLFALGWSLVTTPVYSSTARLFVSTTSGTLTATDLFSSGQYAEQRVESYTRLVTGLEVADRTVAATGLDMAPTELQSKISADATPGTVLIDVTVSDESPERARDLANAVSLAFSQVVEEIERPSDGSPAPARVSVASSANLPDSPVVPATERNVAFGMILGFVLGMALAVLRHRLDRRVQDSRSLAGATGAPVMGTLPEPKASESMLIDFDAEDYNASAEAYRIVRANVEYSAAMDTPASILVTSPWEDEGKTAVASNLAVALAKSGRNVVLVDGNLRGPEIANLLGVDGSVGLASVLAGDVPLAQALRKLDGGPTVLPAGPVPRHIGELVGRIGARDLFAELCSSFDYVVVDSAAVLPVADTAVLAKSTTGVLLTARAGRTTSDDLGRAVEAVRAVEGRIIGCVLTFVPEKEYRSGRRTARVAGKRSHHRRRQFRRSAQQRSASVAPDRTANAEINPERANLSDRRS